MTDPIRNAGGLPMKGGRVLVTGAYGLIGHQTVLALKAAGFEATPTDILTERPVDAAFDASPLAISGVEPLRQFLKAHRIEGDRACRRRLGSHAREGSAAYGSLDERWRRA